MNTSIRAVIFDLDGTITEPIIDFDAIRLEMGLDTDAGPVWEAMEKMSPQRRKETERILHYHEQKAVDESTLNSGARETLDTLRKAGIKIGILTRNTAGNAIAVMKKHNLEYDRIIGREDGPVKPDAFGVLELCKRFEAQPEQVLMVGDYLFDLLCAKEAGAIAVLLANHENADQFAQHADYTIETIDEILEIIEEKKKN